MTTGALPVAVLGGGLATFEFPRQIPSVANRELPIITRSRRMRVSAVVSVVRLKAEVVEQQMEGVSR